MSKNYRSSLYASLVAEIIEASHTLKNPNAKSVITKITKKLHSAAFQCATTTVPVFVKASPENYEVRQTMAHIDRAKVVYGTYPKIKSWNDALQWLLHVEKLISGVNSHVRCTDEILLIVFRHVRQLQQDIDFDWLAVVLGYSSVEEADVAAKSLIG